MAEQSSSPYSNGTTSGETILSPLLALPAEIRNSIYEYALVLPDTMLWWDNNVLDDTFEPPGLLLTCKQIREETIQIYYTQNQFWLLLNDFVPDRAIAWLTTATKYVDRLDLDVQWDWGMWGSGSGTWPNLLRLLEYAHAQGLPPLCVGTMWYDTTCPETDIHLGRLFEINRELSDVPWEKVRKVLVHYALGTNIGLDDFMQ